MPPRMLIAAIAVAVLAPLPGARATEPQDPPKPRCDMGSCYDPLFTVQYPYTHSFVTSTNVRIPLPARYYDAAVALIVGEGDLATMQAWTVGTPFRPVRTDGGTGIAVLLVARYLDTDLGAYDEAITMFPVSTEDRTVADDPGAMLGALLDPQNLFWTRGLILDQELPIVGGREYLFMPKEPEPKSMDVEIGTAGVVGFDFAEADGTPIANAMLIPDPATSVRPGLGLATSDGTHRAAGEMLALGGNLRLQFVFRNIQDPSSVERMTAVGHIADLSGAMIAECCDAGQIWLNPETSYGADLAAVALRPRAIATVKGLRAVLDIDL